MSALVKMLCGVTFFLSMPFVESCTDFVLFSKSRNVVNGRSMEFGTDLQSEIVLCPSHLMMKSKIHHNQEGMSWYSRYGFFGVSCFGNSMIVDGVNEKGLSFGFLWFPGAEYPAVELKNLRQAIALEDLGSWILGMFASVDEVEQMLPQIEIVPTRLSQTAQVPPFHFTVHDRLGHSLVVEFVDGRMEVSTNPSGVLTNAPQLAWHLTNLSHYINLTSVNSALVKGNGTVLGLSDKGSGLLGFPGDWTPASRFVRIALLKNFAKKARSDDENVYLAFHLLNAVDIPHGVVRSSNVREGFDYTQWAIVKDLANWKVYMRSYDNLNIRAIDVAKEMPLPGKGLKKFPLKKALFKS